MKISSEKNDIYEDEIPLDSTATTSLLWSKVNRNTINALSHDKAKGDKALWEDKASLDKRKTVICDESWYDFVLISKVCLLHDPEADLYDVFNTIRTKLMGGWGFTEEQLKKLDAEIERDYQRGKM